MKIFHDLEYVEDSRWSRLFTDRLSVLTLRLHDKVPVVQKDLKSWKEAKDERLSQLKLSLKFAFWGFALPMNIKRVKVRIVCAANRRDQDIRLQEQADYELDKNALRVLEDEFASELEGWRTICKHRGYRA